MSRYRQVARFEGALPVKLTLAASDLEPWNQQGRLLLQTRKDVLVYDVPSRKQVVALGITGLAPSFILGGREIAVAIPDPLNPDRPRGPLVIHNAQSGRKTREIAAKTPSMVIDYWTLPTGAWAVTMASRFEPQIISSAGSVAINPTFPTQISPDLSRLAELGEFDAVNLRDTWPRPRVAPRPGVSVRPHHKSINRLRFDERGSRILTASDDGTAKLLDAVTGAVLRTFPHGEELRDARFLAGGTRVLTIARYGNTRPKFPMKLWNSTTGELVGAWDLWVPSLGQEGTIAGAESLLFANTGEAVSLIEATMGTFIGWVGVERADLRSVSISPDGRYVAASTEGTTWVWELD